MIHDPLPETRDTKRHRLGAKDRQREDEDLGEVGDIALDPNHPKKMCS